MPQSSHELFKLFLLTCTADTQYMIRLTPKNCTIARKGMVLSIGEHSLSPVTSITPEKLLGYYLVEICIVDHTNRLQAQKREAGRKIIG